MSDAVGGHEVYPSRPDKGKPAYERIETCLCSVLWPLTAVCSAAVLNWLWLDNPQSPGLSAKLASTIFVVILVASTVCTVDAWCSFLLKVLRATPRARH